MRRIFRLQSPVFMSLCRQLTDYRGFQVSTDNPEVISHMDEFNQSFSGFGNKVGKILKAPKMDPTCVGSNALAAAINIMIGSSKSKNKANQLLQQAKVNIDKASGWEVLWTDIVSSWFEGNVDHAINLHLEMAEKYPADLTSVLIGQTLCFFRGDAERQLALSQKTFEPNKHSADVYGGYSFALNQTGQLDEAERIAEIGMSLRDDHPWIHHAIAHNYESRGNPIEGMRTLKELSPGWKEGSHWIDIHNWWHIGLYHLSQPLTEESVTELLRLFDEHLYFDDPNHRGDYNILVDAISFLSRLEMRGIDVGNRWNDIASHAKVYTFTSDQPLVIYHTAYALMKADPSLDINGLISDLSTRAAALASFKNETFILVHTLIPVLQGLRAHVRHEYAEAYRILQPLTSTDQVHCLGGSTPQRDWLSIIARHSKEQLSK